MPGNDAIVAIMISGVLRSLQEKHLVVFHQNKITRPPKESVKQGPFGCESYAKQLEKL
jgi:hypothetical protein